MEAIRLGVGLVMGSAADCWEARQTVWEDTRAMTIGRAKNALRTKKSDPMSVTVLLRTKYLYIPQDSLKITLGGKGDSLQSVDLCGPWILEQS